MSQGSDRRKVLDSDVDQSQENASDSSLSDGTAEPPLHTKRSQKRCRLRQGAGSERRDADDDSSLSDGTAEPPLHTKGSQKCRRLRQGAGGERRDESPENASAVDSSSSDESQPQVGGP